MSGTIGFAPGGPHRFSRNATRSVSGDGLGSIRYPSPFFDIAHTYLPSSFKTMLKWCRYYFLSNPLINAVCYKMAEYPVTDLVFDTDNNHEKNKWSYFFNRVIQMKRFEVECGLDFNCFGNCLVSIFFPFIKFLRCRNCKHAERVDRVSYTFKDHKFHGSCRSCGRYQDFEAFDHPIRSLEGIRMIRWNPENISIRHNEATGESLYYYTIPSGLANDIKMAKRHVIEKTPQIFIEALRRNKSLLFDNRNLFHMKRATIAQKDKGWGLPMILPVLKDTFYLQILRKAQEAIAIEHIVPLRVLFPQSASGTSDVYCVSLDSLVETREGPRPAGEVKVGDLLKSHAGVWRPVERLVDRPLLGAEKAYQIKVASLSAFPFKVSEGHPILAAKKMRQSKGYDDLSEPAWVEAKHLQKGDYVLYPTHRKIWKNLSLDLAEYIQERTATEKYIYRRLNQGSAEVYEFFEGRPEGLERFDHGEVARLLVEKGWSKEDYSNGRTSFAQGSVDRIPRYCRVTEDLAYLVGLYAVEGYLNGGSPCFTLHSREEDLRKRIDKAVFSCGFRAESGTYDVSENGVTHNVHDVLLGEFLKNVCGPSAPKKHLPRFILEAPRAVAMSAVKAVLEGDGCNFPSSTRRVGLSTTSPRLATEVRGVLLSEGYIPTVQVKTPREDEIAKLPSYQMNLNGAQADALAKDFGWETVDWGSTEQCWSRCGFVRDGYVYLRVNEVSDAPGVKTVRGFQIAEDKSFCVVGVATHNSTINLQNWKRKVEQELLRWRLDNNHIPILPLPIGQQTLGAEGRALMLAQEYRVWAEHIVAGMGVPTEFVFGGMQYCLGLPSLVYTRKGLLKIGEMIPSKKASSQSADEVVTHKGVGRVALAHNTGWKKAARIKTRLGLTGEPSHDHRYLVLRPTMETEWVRTKDLQPGDHIAVRSGPDVWPEHPPRLPVLPDPQYKTDVSHRFPVSPPPGYLNEPVADLLGYLVSEGACEGDTIGFGQKDESVMDHFLNSVEEVFGYRPSCYEGADGCFSTEIGRRPAVLWLQELGASGSSSDKEVPECIRRAPKALVAAFLRTYFEGDGSISTTSGKQMVSCGSKSEELLKQIQLLLLNMGVVSSRYFDEGRGMWQLQVRSEYVAVFAREIGFVSARKKAEIDRRTETRPPHLGERIPFLKEALDKFKAEHMLDQSSWAFEPRAFDFEKEEYSVREVATILEVDVTTVYYHVKKGRLEYSREVQNPSGRFSTKLISKECLAGFLRNFGKGVRKTIPGRDAYGMTYSKLGASDLRFIQEKDPELFGRITKLAESRYVWNEVIEVELFDYEVPMGDLTVEGDHSFVADGLVSHNSGSNVSMRILENHFLDHKSDHHALVDWIMERVGAFMGWKPIPHHFKRFKMADDLQRSAFNLQLNQAGKLSDRSLLEETDWDSEIEAERIALEQKKAFENQRRQALSQAEIQGEAQLTMQKYQVRAQKLIEQLSMPPQPGDPAEAGMAPMPTGMPGMMSPGAQGQMITQETAMMNQSGQTAAMAPPIAPAGPEGSQPPMGQMPDQMQSPLNGGQNMGVDPNAPGSATGRPTLVDLAKRVAAYLDQMPDAQKQSHIVELRNNNPQLYSLVAQFLSQRQGAHKPSTGLPSPEQRAPRRGPEAATV